jgi:hypothetical protein
MQEDLFSTVYNHMDELLGIKGKNISIDLKNSIEKLVKIVYFE